MVSTHSHPKVAGIVMRLIPAVFDSFNTQPPEGGCFRQLRAKRLHARFNTQPPEGGWCLFILGAYLDSQFQHTATRRWLERIAISECWAFLFQHTATRRWLDSHCELAVLVKPFQHTATRRWLAAADLAEARAAGFNTQPPEGGWNTFKGQKMKLNVSTHSHPKVAGLQKSLIMI